MGSALLSHACGSCGDVRHLRRVARAHVGFLDPLYVVTPAQRMGARAAKSGRSGPICLSRLAGWLAYTPPAADAILFER
jgi:hypothetical protein